MEVAEFSQKVKNFAGGPARERGFTQTPGNDPNKVPDRAIINYSNYRQGVLTSFNLRDKMLLGRTDDGLRNPEDEAVQELRSDLDRWELIIRDAAPAIPLAPDGPPASVGFVNLLVDRDTDGGLSYMHQIKQTQLVCLGRSHDWPLSTGRENERQRRGADMGAASGVVSRPSDVERRVLHVVGRKIRGW